MSEEEAEAQRAAGDAGAVVDDGAMRLDSKYCGAKAVYSTYEHIKGVKIDAVDSPSGNDSGYREEKAVRRVQPGTYAVTLTPGFRSGSFSEHWRVWIDLNRDGTFADSEILFEGSGSAALTANLVIPTTATRGATAMRVAMRWGAKPPACGSYTYGEVEDYNLEITDRPWQNTAFKYDVSGDGCTAPIDMLILSNESNAGTIGQKLPGIKAPDRGFIDVSGDGYFTALDLLQMTNKMNADGLDSCSKPWQSPVDRLDTNRDGCRTPLDLLVLSNAMNEGTYANKELPATKPADQAYLDANGDKFFTAADLLQLINAANAGELTGCNL